MSTLVNKVERKCSGCESTPTQFCTDCHEQLCDECVEAHKRVKLTRSHNLVSTNELNLKIPDGNWKIWCSTHSSELLAVVCAKCDQLICHSCVCERHKDHQVHMIKDIADKSKTDLQADWDSIQSKMVDIQTSVKSKLTSIEAENFTQFKQAFARIHTELLIREVQLTQAICHSSKVNLLEETGKRLANLNVDEISHLIKSALACGSDILITLAKRKLTEVDNVSRQAEQSLTEAEKSESTANLNFDIVPIVDAIRSIGRPKIELKSQLSETIPDFQSPLDTSSPILIVGEHRRIDNIFDMVQNGQAVADKNLKCAVCAQPEGKLTRCDQCAKGYHRNCHVPKIPQAKQTEWNCSLCANYEAEKDDIRVDNTLTYYERLICQKILLAIYCHPSSKVFHSNLNGIKVELSKSHLTRNVTVGSFISSFNLIFHSPTDYTEESVKLALELKRLITQFFPQHQQHVMTEFGVKKRVKTPIEAAKKMKIRR